MERDEKIEVSALDLIKEYESDKEDDGEIIFEKREDGWYWWINKSVGFYEKK